MSWLPGLIMPCVMLWPIKGQMPWLGIGGPADLGTACVPCSGHTVSLDMAALCKEMDVGILELACVKLSPAQSGWQDREKGPVVLFISVSPNLPLSHYLCPDISIFFSYSL